MTPSTAVSDSSANPTARIAADVRLKHNSIEVAAAAAKQFDDKLKDMAAAATSL